MSKYAHIIEKLENATGPDRELDALACRCLAGWPQNDWFALQGEMMTNDRAPRLTASLDAAIALVEKMLPGSIWSIEQDACWIRTMRGDDVKEYQGFLISRAGKCTPIAILVAMFRALEAKGQTQ